MKRHTNILIYTLLLITLASCSFDDGVLYALPPVTEYSVDFCLTDNGFSGGTINTTQCRYEAPGNGSTFHAPQPTQCTECNITFWVNMGNVSSDNSKFYYATTNTTLTGERYFVETQGYNTLAAKPETGYDFEVGYMPVNEWFKVTIFLNYSSSNSTLYVYNSSGLAYPTQTGTFKQKTFITSNRFFAFYSGSYNDHYWITNFSIIDTLGNGTSDNGSSGGGGVSTTGNINLTLNSPLNGSSLNQTSVNLSVTVWNNQNPGSSSSSSGITVLADYNFTSTSEGWTLASGQSLDGNWYHDATSGQIIYNGSDSGVNLYSPNLSLTQYTNGYNISITATSVNVTNWKLHYENQNGASLTGDKYHWERHNETHGQFKHDSGSFSATDRYVYGTEQTFLIYVNYSANITKACRVGGSCSGSEPISGTQFKGDYIAIDSGTNGGFATNKKVFNITRVTVYNLGGAGGTTQNNASLNVSFYAGNNTLIYSSNGTQNGSTVSYNWSTTTAQSYNWYVTVKTINSTLNVTPLSFTTLEQGSSEIGTLVVSLVSPSTNSSVLQNKYFNFTINVSCTGNGSCGDILAYLDPVTIQNQSWPYNNASVFNSRTVQAWIEKWNGHFWDDSVSCGFNTARPMCAVMWFSNTQTNDDATLHNCIGTPPGGAGCTKSITNKQFPFVTDEGGNGLLMMAVGLNQTRFELLWNFTDLISHTNPNGLQCWAGHVNGVGSYTNHSQLCSTSDSASDASIRILGALSIACAKQRSNIWHNQTGGFRIDYCSAFVTQGDKIWGYRTSKHGEVKKLSSGRWYLANGYNNQVTAPTSFQSFRPDYYELWALMDYAEYRNNDTMVDGVMDMLEAYEASMSGVGGLGVSATHYSKTGHFNSDGLTGYACDEGPNSCSNGDATGTFVDQIDTWRAMPSLGQLLANHPENIPSSLNSTIYNQWWLRYAGGNSTYCATCAKPMEIYTKASAGNLIRSTTGGARGLAMWMPLGTRFSFQYVNDSAERLTSDSVWHPTFNQFRSEGYFDAYFSSFSVRALASGAGLMSHQYYASVAGGGGAIEIPPTTDYNKNGSLVSTNVGDTPFYTINSNPQGSLDPNCLSDMTNGSSCLVSWTVNATGLSGSDWEFFAYALANGTGSTQANSSMIVLRISDTDTVAPFITSVSNTTTNTSFTVSWLTDESANQSLHYGTTKSLGAIVGSASLSTIHSQAVTGLPEATYYYYNITSCDGLGNCNTTGPYNTTTNDTNAPRTTAHNVTTTSTTAIVSWTTNEPSNASVSYGTTTSLGTTTGSATLATIRNITLSGLTQGVTYYYNFTSCDNSSNCRVNGTFSFSTQSQNATSATVSLCSGVSALAFRVNYSLVNSSTNRTTQQQFAYGTTSCSLKINTTGELSNVIIRARVNQTNASYAVQFGTVNLTTTNQVIANISPNSIAQYNVTGHWVNATVAFYPFKLTVNISTT